MCPWPSLMSGWERFHAAHCDGVARHARGFRAVPSHRRRGSARDFHIRNIRRVVERLRREYDRPLHQLVFATSGGEIYFQHPDGEWEGDQAKDQIVLQSVIIDLDVVRARIQQDTKRRSEDSGRVERRRKVHGSKQVFAGTRIPVESVQRYLIQGYDATEILAAYPELTVEDVEAARRDLVVA